MTTCRSPRGQVVGVGIILNHSGVDIGHFVVGDNVVKSKKKDEREKQPKVEES